MTSRFSRLDRRALFANGVAAALLAATGVSANGAPQRGGRFRVALSGGARSDTWVSGDGLFMQVARQGLIFDNLTEIGANGSLRPELATSWQSADDGRRWRFDLRSGIAFHDGAPFGARDVASSLGGRFAGLGHVEAKGSQRIEIELNDPNPHLPFHLAQAEFVIRPAHAPQAGIGTGLYQLKEFNAGQRLVTRRVSEHYKDGNAGWFDEVELVSISSESVRVQAVAEYLVDAGDISDPSMVQALSDARWQPSDHAPEQVVSDAIGQPGRIGQRQPLDDLRASERWWFA